MKNDFHDFAVFILTHGRPGNQKTYKTLKRSNYSGRIFFIVDDLDKTKDQYVKMYGDRVIIFDKKKIAQSFDQADNFTDMRSIVYARNASFEIAQKLGLNYFIQLDDDYTGFYYRFDDDLNFIKREKQINNIDAVFLGLLQFFKKTSIASIAMAQSGDFIGGSEGTFASEVTLRRKCMNSFLCSVERPFTFLGRINEDVNTYTHRASQGLVFFTTNQVALKQTATQKNAGGMTDLYLDSGTYVKSFYSVIFHPSSVKIKIMNSANGRLHHSISWPHTTPMILSEKWKK
jgi:hypothetical protein